MTCKLILHATMWPLAAVIVTIALVGIFGQFQITEKCLVTDCSHETLFYQGDYTQFTRLKLQFDRVEQDKIKETNGEVYSFATNCTQVPDVHDCYFHEGKCYSRGPCALDEMWGVREWAWGWIAFLLLLVIPGLVLGLTRSLYCDCGRCKLNRPGRIVLIVSGFVYAGLVLTFMIVGGLGFYDNIPEQCLKSACAVESTIGPDNRWVDVPKVTLMSYRFNEKMMPKKLEYTYYAYDKTDCSEIPSLIPCYYSTGQNRISIVRVHNPIFAAGILLFFGTVAFWVPVCCI